MTQGTWFVSGGFSNFDKKMVNFKLGQYSLLDDWSRLLTRYRPLDNDVPVELISL